MNTLKLFTGKYQRQLTLRNALLPVGQTLANLQKHGIVAADEKLEKQYQEAKLLIDDYHRYFINNNLTRIALNWEELAQSLLAFQHERNEETKAKLEKVQTAYRKQLLKAFTEDENYKYLFKKELFTKVLPAFYTDKTKLAAISSFKNFFTYFSGFNENRANIYSTEAISTAIGYRLIHENFPKFLANCEIFAVLQKLCPQVIASAETALRQAEVISSDVKLEAYFLPNSFNAFLTQSGIDKFNNIIGELNTNINLAIQQSEDLKHSLRSKRAIKMFILYKQILSKDDDLPFIDAFENDNQLRSALQDFYNHINSVGGALTKAAQLFQNSTDYQEDKIYISGKEINSLSKALYGGSNWNTLREAILLTLQHEKDYKKLLKDNDDTAIDKKLSKNYFSLAFLQQNADAELREKIKIYFMQQHELAVQAVTTDLTQEENFKASVKKSLDILFDYYRFAAIFKAEDSLDKDAEFYSIYDEVITQLKEIVYLYNKTRNYLTKKPFNEEKFKLNFGNAQLAGGWDANKEADYTSILLTKDGCYYLGIMNKNHKPDLDAAVTQNTVNIYHKMVYKYFPDFSKMFIKCTMVKEVKNHFQENTDDFILKTSTFNRPLKITKEIYDLYSTEYDGKKKFQIDYLRQTGDVQGYYEALNKWIAFALDFIRSYASTSIYDISQIEAAQYERLDTFYKDLNNIFYKISFVNLDAEQLDKWVEDGSLYLFKIYNKDFATGRNGTKNLHTLYLEGIFDEQNLQDVVIKLNGGAELFYRHKTKGTAAIHAKGSKLVNRTTADGQTIPEDIYQEIYLYANGKKDILSTEAQKYYPQAVIKTATHDIIKDRRYYEDKFFFHFPITINYKAPDSAGTFNQDVLEYLRHNPDINIIGIDRGERNLIYITVINQQGKILFSKSFNTISQHTGTLSKTVDYHDKLHKREQQRTEARKSWETIGKIATLKEGYLSAVIHEIAKCMIEYNAIIVMEDLNAGFKRMRGGIAEKAVYQKFEKMLIDKLNYLVFKNTPASEPGSILKGYQLSSKFESFEKMGKQNGFIFYVPAAFTSKIDPVTGFSSVFKFKDYNANTEKLKSFFTAFDTITYNPEQDVFTFSFDYDNFKTYAAMYRKKWQVSSYGLRIVHQKVDTEHFTDSFVNPTQDIKNLLHSQGINFTDGQDILPKLLQIDDNKGNNSFWRSMFTAFQQIVQLRNSSRTLTTANGQEADYIISPVADSNGYYYDSTTADTSLPQDADANGAYHIALKGLMYLQINNSAKDNKPKLYLKNDAWFKFVQTRNSVK